MKGNIIKRITNAAYIIVSTAVIVTGIAIAVLYLSGIRFYRVRSGSMGDAVPLGSLCFVSTYSAYENVDVGDIISFRLDDDVMVTHRACEITDKGVITKGDCNQGEDPDPVTSENYIGKTIFAIPYLGKAFGWLHTVKGRVMLGLSVVVIIISGNFFKLGKQES